MKKLVVSLLMGIMVFSFTACGNEYKEAAEKIEEITGQETTAEDIKEAIEEMEELTGEEMTVEEFIEFTESMYALAEGDWEDYEPEDEDWPYKDIPEWPVAEGLNWADYYGEGQIDIFVTGGEDEMNEWLAELRKEGFKGYFWEGDELEYYSDNYWIYLEDRGAEEGQYHIVVREGDMELGYPEELEDYFPEYNGDGALLYGGMDEYDGECYYYFSAIGETEEGALRYFNTLVEKGFETEDGDYYSAPEGYYYKTVGGKTVGYVAEDYWYDFDDETQTGWGDFCLTVEEN